MMIIQPDLFSSILTRSIHLLYQLGLDIFQKHMLFNVY